ncbi:MAG: DNA glycosylase [Eubacteriales bacterium]|nr:DNA glycosylase [Eubacteriales bacterium]
MITRKIPHFDLAQIAASGQCFRMEQDAEGCFWVPAGETAIRIRQQGDICSFDCSEEDFRDFWESYFDLTSDYQVFLDQIDPQDTYLGAASRYGGGIRILRQQLWETIVSFLISQQNNIRRIRRCIDNICSLYGEEKTDRSGRSYHTFPRPEALAGLAEDQLMACNLGYRSKYVVRAARSVVSGDFDLARTASLAYPEAREALMGLYGVGGKVADCICLMSLHHLEAFPVDTHIRQALERHYKAGFPSDRYRGFQGVLQQYIFYYELLGSQAAKDNAPLAF